MKNIQPFFLDKQGIRLLTLVVLLCFGGAFRLFGQTGNAWNTGPYCLGQTISLYSNYGTSWSWSGPNGFTSNLQDPFIANASAIHVGVYTVDIGQPNGSFISANTTVAVNTTVNLCHGDLAHNFSIAPVAGAVDYQWFVDGNALHTSILSGQATTAIVVDLTQLSDGLHDITAMVNTNSCLPPTTCLSIYLPPILQISASNNGPFCAGEAIQLLSVPTGGVTPYSFNWAGPDGFVANVQNPVRGNSTMAMSGTYSVTVTDANGCTKVTTTSLSVGNAPTATVSSIADPYCIGENIAFSVNNSSGLPPFTYSWRGPGGWTDNQQNPTRNGATVSMSGSYIITVTDQTGCFDIDTLPITVNPAPIAAASNSGPYCFGQTINLTASGGATYAWSGPNGFTSGLPSPIISNATAAQQGIYTLNLFDANACSATTTTFVAVSACTEVCNDGIDNDGNGLVDCYDAACNTQTVITGTEKMLCFGGTSILTASGGTTYLWASGGTTQSISATTSGLYEVTATNGQGCTNTASFSLEVHPIPLAAVGSVDPICERDTLKLLATGGVTYHWAGPANWTGHGANPVFPGITPSFSGTYSVTAANSFGCTAVANIPVQVNPIPKDVDALGAAITCGNAFPFIVGNTSTPNVSWSWTGPNAFNSVLQTSTVGVPGIFTGRATIPATGCFVLDTAVVYVDTSHFVLNSFGGTLNCVDTVIRLNVLANVNNATYLWSGPLGFSSTFQRPIVDQTGSYSVVATNPKNGCTETATALINATNQSPTIAATGGLCDCENPRTQLTATSSIPNAKYYWSGPGGFGSRKQNPFVAQGGTYSVYAVDPLSGCHSVSATVTVLVIQ
jgi:PKD-like domain